MELLEPKTTLFFEKKIFGKNFYIFGGAGGGKVDCFGWCVGSVVNYCAVFDLRRCNLNLIVPFVHRVGIKKTALCGGLNW
jgi:hypothetical protein